MILLTLFWQYSQFIVILLNPSIDVLANLVKKSTEFSFECNAMLLSFLLLDQELCLENK